MKIRSLTIHNFKSIQDLRIEEIESAMIVVGKNNTGKTVILDAILAMAGYYQIRPTDFGDGKGAIEIGATLEIADEDLAELHQRGVISRYKSFEAWFREFRNRLPSFQENTLSFTCTIHKDGKISYNDGVRRNNKYIPMLIPKIHYIDHRRELTGIQNDIFVAQTRQDLAGLRDNRCVFDESRKCSHCFNCIHVINRKAPADITITETVRLLEYKLFHLNVDAFASRLNQYFHKNSGRSQDIRFEMKFNIDELFHIDTLVINNDRYMEGSIEMLSEGIKSIYILSLLEAYIDDMNPISSIIMIEDPESYLHPQLQKVAGEILYRLSKKNQIIFSTHSPNLLFNFTSRQIKQVVLDENYYTTIRENVDIDEILDDLGYTANDLMNVSFVFIVEGKQDRNRLPLLLEKYYSEIYDEDGMLQRISIIPTNSCTNIKTYANLKYINKLYLKDQFLMIRDSDGKNPKYLVKQLCSYYGARSKEEGGDSVPRVQPRNVLVLRYYSFENYFLEPAVMAKIGVIKSEEEFYSILYAKYKAYLYKVPSMKRMIKVTGARINSKEDLKNHMEAIKIYVRGHNLYDIFYGRYKGDAETEILKKYIDAAPRETFQDILQAIDNFVYFQNRKKEEPV
ncbi:ATP-dependent nuclease [Diplocloster agilis]|uniref:ATP-dependent nuclease n=1 Tax=Diplocloster agilis TaxID=2850323 RepID=UPI00082034CB|nr:AAA family ATPase [Suonthocola fibrivorans]MCU6732145.1 AAA family ATPase [Suonthocola fibrivorans]SCI35095.1 chromosome segregation protein [uncultured Clostridium sp.]